MTNRGKHPKVLSPKKVSRRKRTPRCDTCGKRDGDDAGDEGQAKVRLKLCARCRGVAYCGMECQKAGWKAHREVCVKYPSGADLPAPSPLVNHQKMPVASARGRRRVIYAGAVGTGGATPRQRDIPPSKHPFFGRHEPSERETHVLDGKYPSTKAAAPSARKSRQQQQQEEEEERQMETRRQQEAQPAPEEDTASCPSPPTMQRLSFAGGAGRSRAGSSSGRGRSRRSTSDSTTPSATKQPRQGARGVVAAAVKKAASRVRRSTYTLPNGLRSRGSLSPRRAASDEAVARGSASGPVRRESAPLYPVALEKSRRASRGAAASSAPRSATRGPPPPYASVAHRADSIKNPSRSTSPEEKGWIKGSPAGGPSERGKAPRTTFGQTTKTADEKDAAMPPALPPRGTSPGAGSPPPLPLRGSVHSGGSCGEAPLSAEVAGGVPTRFSEPSPERQDGKEAGKEAAGEKGLKVGRNAEGGREPEGEEEEEEEEEKGRLGSVGMIPEGVGEGLDGLRVSKEGEEERVLAHEREEEDTEEPTPERKDEDVQVQDAFRVPEEDLPRSPAEDPQGGIAAGSAERRGDSTVVPARSFLREGSAGGSSQDSAAGSTVAEGEDTTVRARPFLSTDSAESSSQDSAAGSAPVVEQENATVGARSFLSEESAEGYSQDSAAGSTAGVEDSAIRLRPALANDSAGSSSQDSAAGCSAEREKKASPARPSLARSSAAGSSEDSAACSAVGREDGLFRAWPTEDSAHTAWPTEDNAQTAWPTEASAHTAWPTMKDGGNAELSRDSAAGSAAGQGVEQEGNTLAAGPIVTPSQESPAGCKASQEGSALPTPLSMEPPGPLLPSTASSNPAASGASRSPNGGPFDSCPPSAGASSDSGPQRSLSVGTAPQYHSMPMVAAAKGIATAAAAVAAWNVNRRNSPRPRPPVSPGPAALSHSFPSKPSFRLRKHSAADPDDEGPLAAAFAAAAAAAGPFGGRKMSAPALSRTTSARSFSTTASGRASPVSGAASPRSPPFVPAVELSARRERPESPPPPGPRPTGTAAFYRERSGARADKVDLPPPSRAYLGRPEGFSVHVLVASAATAADLASKREVASVGAGGSAGDGVEEHSAGGDGNNRRLYYSFEDRERVASALQPGDVVLVTPGRYEAGAWGLQHLISSVEIIGAGEADDCVLYNKPAARSGPAGDHYLVGVMGGALGDAGGAGTSVPEVKGKDSLDDDSDSGFEEGAFGVAASSIAAASRRAVRVRLANLTLEQGSGYRGAVHQLGRESHLEMDGCTVLCSQGGINVDQGTCVIRDSRISGSEAFGVHIGGEGAVEHCSIRDCGRGGGAGRRAGKAGSAAGESSTPDGTDDDDDGTDVNRVGGMPAISVLQSSRVRVRYNVIRENAGHSLQCRDAPLPGGNGKYAVLARRAEAEAAEKLRSWLGSAAVLLREHLQEQHREGSIISEGNQCQLNRGCDAANCAAMPRGREGAVRNGTAACPATAAAPAAPENVGGEGSETDGAARRARGDAAATATGGGGGEDAIAAEGKQKPSSSDGRPIARTHLRACQTCSPTAEEEGIPLPAAMTLRFLAAMDDGYVGSRREENARLERRRKEEGAG